MAYFSVTYLREGKLTDGRWTTVIDKGFLSRDCTREEIEDFVYNQHCISDENTRYSFISIVNCPESQLNYFDNNLLNTMIKEVGKAKERLRQKNC